jgi:hypothetical protein
MASERGRIAASAMTVSNSGAISPKDGRSPRLAIAQDLAAERLAMVTAPL